MKTYLTADLHINHFNVIGYCNRPFASVEEMDAALIANWNAVVSQEDRVVFLGDFSMRGQHFLKLRELNFATLVFVYGNHDRLKDLDRYLENELADLKPKIHIEKEIILTLGGKDFHCVHQPILGSDELLVLCGHVHSSWAFCPPGTLIQEHSRGREHLSKVTKTPILNVGVDCHGYTPISEETVLSYFKDY